MKNILDIIAMFQPLILSGLPAKPINDAVERAFTIPKKDREKIYAARGLSAEDRAKAEELFKKAADAQADVVVFVAGKGLIEVDD